MKSLFLAALLLIGFGASAQNGIKLGKLKRIDNNPTFGSSLFSDTTVDKYRLWQSLTPQNSLLPESKFSHITLRGKVYSLPFDNMPCLVPDMEQFSRMPILKLRQGKMPNAIPEQPMIPGKENEEKKEDKEN